jgi:hypothetical protein
MIHKAYARNTDCIAAAHHSRKIVGVGNIFSNNSQIERRRLRTPAILIYRCSIQIYNASEISITVNSNFAHKSFILQFACWGDKFIEAVRKKFKAGKYEGRFFAFQAKNFSKNALLNRIFFIYIIHDFPITNS